jgi:hypothetical protein
VVSRLTITLALYPHDWSSPHRPSCLPKNRTVSLKFKNGQGCRNSQGAAAAQRSDQDYSGPGEVQRLNLPREAH